MLTHKLSRTALCLVAAVGLLGLGACSSDTTDPGAGAPAMPAQSTMEMDLSFFGLAGIDLASKQKGSPSEELLAAYSGKFNFINAVVRALYVHLIMYATFEAPVGAFAAAIHSIPQPQPDGSWLWTFIFVEDGIDYSIFLYGQDMGDYTAWRMEVSSTDPEFMLDHFVWFDGQAMNDDTSGYWQFYIPDENPPAAAAGVGAAMTPGRESVLIQWSNVPVGTHQLSILVNEVGSPDEGDSVVFLETPQMSSIDYDDVSAAENHNITWYPDGSGSITVPDYNNGQTACWDTHQRDVACP